MSKYTCVESTKPILRSCIVNLLQRTNNGDLFSFVQSIGRVQDGNKIVSIIVIIGRQVMEMHYIKEKKQVFLA